jgi:hypothetical protein
MSTFDTRFSKGMLETLITSKTRLKLLLKFFLNSSASGYLRSLEGEFGESTNAIRQELNKFESAGLLSSASEGNKKVFRANVKHPLYSDIRSLLMKHIGLDTVIDNVIKKLGDVEAVFLVGKFARGIDNQIIDLVFVGESVNKNFLVDLIQKAEKLISRKIRYIVYSLKEYGEFEKGLTDFEPLLLWKREE